MLVITQTPPKALFFEELARCCIALLLSLGSVVAYEPEQLTPFAFINVVVSSLATTFALPLICTACGDATFAPYHVAQGDHDYACPPSAHLRGMRNTVCNTCARWVRSVLGGDILLECVPPRQPKTRAEKLAFPLVFPADARPPSYASLAGLFIAGVVVMLRTGAPLPASDICGGILLQAGCCVALSLGFKLRAGSLASLRLLENRLGGGAGAGPTLAEALADRLAASGSERELLRRASASLLSAFPAAVALCVATLSEPVAAGASSTSSSASASSSAASASYRVITDCELHAQHERDRRALAGALPERVCPNDGSSIAFVTSRDRRGAAMAHSGDWETQAGGAGAGFFSDWAAARRCVHHRFFSRLFFPPFFPSPLLHG